jgi:predicted ATPase/class 3 adenylate cyclase/Tfp pilus assembly protein PilF
MPQNAVLLISDIVDSTHLASTLGSTAYAELFEAHDQIVRRLADIHRGRELSRSDGVLMRFHTVAGAAAFAVAYHANLATIGDAMQVRIGIHVGLLELRNADELRSAQSGFMAGLAVPMTARIAALASGRQTLISRAAREVLDQTPFRVVSHGHWRLKGIDDPVEVFEVGSSSTVFAPPADVAKAYCVVRRNGLWLPRREIAHSLPGERDHFVGRDHDLNEIARLVDADARCITIVGPGGVGKTRLAQRFGWRWLGEFEGGVWYCDLAQSTTCDGLVSAVAQGLGLSLGASSPIEQIASALHGRGSCVVILDNFEQITRFARDTLSVWLDAAATARFIVTSRTILGLAGETVHRLKSMEPHEGADLFAERAVAANNAVVAPQARERTSDALQGRIDRDAETIASLVHLLDGNPLAIELAAARLRIMDLPTLLQRMRERFKLLARGTGRVARHATLRATLNWSWDLLARHEKSALAQTSVFEGGFDLSAFEAVVNLDDEADAPAPMDVLQSLVEQSLIQQLSARRFGLLISVQEYAAEHLAVDAGHGAPSPTDAAGLRHARYFAALDETAATAEQCIEIDNLVMAVRRSIALGDEATASLALVNCWAALKQCGPYRIGESLATSVRGMPSLSAASQSRVDFVAGSALQDMGETAAADTCYQRGIAAARDGGAKYEEARLLRARGELELAAGRQDAARTTLNEALAAARTIDDALLQCIALNALGTLAQSSGDNRAALGRYGEALAIAERIGHQRWAGALLGNMGIALYGLDDRDGAKSHYVRALAIAVQFGDQRWIGNTRSNLGLVLSDQGQHEEAIVELEAALKIARQLGHRRLECIVLWNSAITRAAQGLFADAIASYEDARTIAIRLGDRQSATLLDKELEQVRHAVTSK